MDVSHEFITFQIKLIILKFITVNNHCNHVMFTGCQITEQESLYYQTFQLAVGGFYTDYALSGLLLNAIHLPRGYAPGYDITPLRG